LVQPFDPSRFSPAVEEYILLPEIAEKYIKDLSEGN
jgi:hypothetical protein